MTTKLSTRSIAELEKLEVHDPGAKASPLARRCYQLVNTPLSSLSVADWRILIVQGIGLDFLMAPALDVVEKDPLFKTDHFQGDLLVSLLGAGLEFFSRHPDIRSRLEKLLDSLPAALDELDFINFDTTSEALEEAAAEFRKRDA
jgi:hypothetical protein